ncbi:MAG: branched-chain amino acid ABC transporter substrate-binding protein, partial [Candidatus Thiodiazotropha sp.]
MSRSDRNDNNKRFGIIPLAVLVWLCGLLPVGVVRAATLDIPIALLGVEEQQHIPLSLLVPTIDDTGQPGAEQGISDNNTTGRFTGQSYQLTAVKLKPEDSLSQAFIKLHDKGIRLFLLNLPTDKLLALADLPQAKDSLLFNIADKDDELRTHLCRPNLLHTMPSR